MSKEKDLKEGMMAPGFSLMNDQGGEVALESLRGKPVVLYFYPKDDTPGCTKQACAFTNRGPEFRKLGATIVGVSKDPIASHAKFRTKYGLDFPLLSDTSGKVMDAYGVWKERTLYGRTALGVERSTFLIDREGVIRRAWRKVKVDGHDDVVLEALKELSNLPRDGGT
jgi:peroxiredoxin Q/BCP